MRTPFRTPIRSMPLIAVLVAVTPVSAVETTVQNDSAATAAQATPCHCFLEGERTAVWLTSPCTGQIVAVQILWESQLGGASDSMEHSIILSQSGTFPVPGATLQNAGAVPAVIATPTLQDGVYNEFRFLDVAQTTPLNVAVSNGQTFVAALRFFNTNSGQPSFGTMTFDDDGCQSGKNAALVQPADPDNPDPGEWSNACPLGVTGDWVIRAVVDCQADEVPAASHWGLIALALLVLSTGTIMILRHRPIPRSQ